MVDRGGFLTDADRKILASFPATVHTDDLIRCFTMTASDLELVAQRRSPSGRLAGALHVGVIRMVGFVPDDLESAPAEVVEFCASQTNVDPRDLRGYSERRWTRQEHVAAVETHLGFRKATLGDVKALGDWLVERALEHDRPIVLFTLACEHLRTQRLVRPGISVLERAVVTARQRAISETFLRIADQLPERRRNRLDNLIRVDEELGVAPLVWLRQEAPAATSKAIRAQLEKIVVLRAIGAEEISLEGLNPNRIRHLATLGKRMTPQAIARLEPERRYQILAATVVGGLGDRIDETLELFDLAMTTAERNSRNELAAILKDNAAAANDTVALFNSIASIVIDPAVPDDEVRRRILEHVGRTELNQAIERAALIHRPQSGWLDLLCNRYTAIRRFSPHILSAFDFRAATPDDPLLAAVEYLRDLELKPRKQKLMANSTPTAFAPKRWQRYMTNTDGSIDRRIWEVCVVSELRGALRGANAWVTHSSRFQDPTKYLIKSQTWQRLEPEYTQATGVDPSPTKQLQVLGEQLDTETALFNEAVDETDLIRIEDGKLIVTPLESEDGDEHDPALEQLRTDIGGLMPRIELVELLVEVDSWTGFLDKLDHADNASTRSADHNARTLAAIVAHGCNFGIANMARASGFSQGQLAWTNTWHLRTETLRAANDTLVNHIIEQPIAQKWGSGTLSSSDGQRFPVTIKHPRARANPKYFKNKGMTIYTWTSDRHAQYGTRVIPTTAREATYVLDAIFDNETNLTIEEHTTDTAGYTDLVFGLFHLCGLRFSPRIRDIADQRLWHLPNTNIAGKAEALKWQPIRTARIIDRWDDMRRVAATIRHGHLPASVLISRLQSSTRQNQLTQALQEYGRLPKSIWLLQYLHDASNRRRVGAMLNKGESFHALRAEINFANQGKLRARTTDNQDLQGECLTLIANAISCWNTTYTQAALDHIQQNRAIDDRHIARLSTATHQHINLYGKYNFINPATPPTGRLRPLNTTNRSSHVRNP